MPRSGRLLSTPNFGPGDGSNQPEQAIAAVHPSVPDNPLSGIPSLLLLARTAASGVAILWAALTGSGGSGRIVESSPHPRNRACLNNCVVDPASIRRRST